MAEGLSGLAAVDKGLFIGYNVNDNISFPILQFADDTILMCEGSYGLICGQSRQSCAVLNWFLG